VNPCRESSTFEQKAYIPHLAHITSTKHVQTHNMDLIDLSRGQSATLQDALVLESLPPEILEIIRLENSSSFLDAVAAASLVPILTLRFFARFEAVFADTCARWISDSGYESQSVIEAFARILRFAPHLSVYLEKYLEQAPRPSQSHGQTRQELTLQYLSGDSRDDMFDLSELQLQRLLLAALRLLVFDKRTYTQAVSLSKIQSLLKHSSRSVRYLAAKILCHLLSASDAKLEEMINVHVGREDAVMGDFDGVLIDYGFLGLYEERAGDNLKKLRIFLLNSTRRPNIFRAQDLSSLVTLFDGILLPRPNGQPIRPSSLVRTVTTSKNMRNFAEALLSDAPILVHGLSGSGKTSLVNDLARELGKDSQMVTLHLNEQTDAKMLIGMYTTDSTPGAFTWRPGVLTTAIREGRWVFIEDLDRAPNEVVSVILPLIERREILIPSRAETVKAASGFRLVASIRTSLNMSGNEIEPATHMLGARLWKRVPVQMPVQGELMEIINGTHPILHKFLTGILAVYDRLYALSQKPSFASNSRTSIGCSISPRDLFKWCRRLDAILVAAGSKTGEEPISEKTKDEMFMEAADCFASSLQTSASRKSVIYAIAEEMHISAQRAEHYLDAHIPRYEEHETYLQAGRVEMPKRKILHRISEKSPRSRPFANTAHSKRLLEQVGVALKMSEPILLVGETGVGKTAVIQQLADSLGYKLTAINLSQQSEVGDLLGGFKPVNVRNIAIPLKEEFDDLFSSTGISTTRNQKYLEHLGKCVAKGQWSKASKLWHEAPRMFDRILSELSKPDPTRPMEGGEQPTKRRKTNSRLQTLLELKPRWEHFARNLDLFDVQLSGGSRGFAFTFVEGNIIKAVRNGDWVLLDEINLASPDTLESIADLLHNGPDGSPSILLSETGEIERVRAHPEFRIFGAMNPATDVGKRDLPIGLRSRFTEIFVESPDRDLEDLLSVIHAYLKGITSNDERAAHDVARLYLNTKRLADEKRLVDGANEVPHFSLRTLTRVLGYATEIAPSYGLRRALYEGYAMGFLTLLNGESERMLIPLINHHLLDSHSNPQSLLSQAPRHPTDGRQYVRFTNTKRDRQYWMLQGRETPQEQLHYIITPFVERNMLNLVRATSTRKFPVLVQGPTSSGKTSMIEYLAKFSGNKFVRINNHEHTDLQEYLGSYVSGSDGQLRFQEGLLVQALREGHWIVLDELNLAPSDVLEALNRLLDDNRELLIPETQEVVRPHENFMLFATQNPPGLYGGRKTLSRAFRNRFLELHFDDIPEDELEYILEHRSRNVAPSDCKRIVTVYKELSRLRQSNRLFEQKDSFATLRDLFRWASRNADNREQLAANGYMLLAERVRKPEERSAVKEIIEKVMKVKLDPNVIYDPHSCPEIELYNNTANTHGVVWNNAMRRLYILVAHALRNNEPVLLVGDTGCGKTTVCQMLAEAFGKELHIVNAHQNTETGDLIGAQRPVRNRAAIAKQLENDLLEALQSQDGREISNTSTIDLLLAAYDNLSDEARAAIPEALRQSITLGRMKAKSLFEWADGSLVHAMKEGQFFLLDEISLADDSVLERLNSVLEAERTLLLAEKGVVDSFVQAFDGFQFFATMNPGGDYGKRELSPALRNRFTEIWVPSLSDHADVLEIVNAKLSPTFKHFAKAMVKFAEWFGHSYRPSTTQSISVRDILAWIAFVNTCSSPDLHSAIMHGAAMIYIDTLGANPAALLAIDPATINEERGKCIRQLSILLNQDVTQIYTAPVFIEDTNDELRFGLFSIRKTPTAGTVSGFVFQAPTTKLNAMRILRALQLRKPILIEGNPGVGKTTLVGAIARVVGKPLTRINLSEQTDLMDLFGSDVPVEGADAGNFAWRDAPFLRAMQNGDWVLLDEMNLASQSVLEGLNACIDHRGTVYISELDQTFKRHPDFCVFAAQNPHHQGGGRKGLPSSFVNRFTVVYADVFSNDDLTLICKRNFPAVKEKTLSDIIAFVSSLEKDVVYRRRFGSQGGPWEFNLRDSLRWLQLLSSSDPLLASSAPADFLDIIFRQRFRTTSDRLEVERIYTQVFEKGVPFRHYFHNMSTDGYQVGMAYLSRQALVQRLPFPTVNINAKLPELESIMTCVRHRLPCLLVGPPGSGKTTLIQQVAAATGAELVVFALNSDIDTIDLVGGYEQVDSQRASSTFLMQLSTFIETCILSSLPGQAPSEAFAVLSLCQNSHNNSVQYFTELYNHLLALQGKTNIPEISKFVIHCKNFIHQHSTMQTARFEWVDGILIKALEEGKWLVLDNANLCSSSVLDRLNSLLEPNGALSVNEHCGPDGEPKVAKPHPDFRLFMTMDPRFGELSRAMRNRAVEIYIDIRTNQTVIENTLLDGFHGSDKSLQRYSRVIDILQAPCLSDQGDLLASVALDHLSMNDTGLLGRFNEAIRNTYLTTINTNLPQVFHRYMRIMQSKEYKTLREEIQHNYGLLLDGLDFLENFKDAQVSDRAVLLGYHTCTDNLIEYVAYSPDAKLTFGATT
jgi:midasin